MEGDDRYPWKLREHGEAASALSSSNIKERAIQNLAKLDAMSLAIPNGENNVIPQEMITPNNPIGENDGEPDATESGSLSMLNPSHVTRSFASYTSTEESASSSEILLSEITANFS